MLTKQMTTDIFAIICGGEPLSVCGGVGAGYIVRVGSIVNINCIMRHWE